MIKAILKKRDEGFTLVELMIVVAIIGVLAALAIYGVSRYLKHSKTAEANRALGTIENGSKAQFQLDTDTSGPPPTGVGPFAHVFCVSALQTPTTVPLGAKVAVTSPVGSGTNYDQLGWKCLKFVMTDPQFYSYTYSSDAPTGMGTNAHYTATANGDLDGNGTQSTFQLNGIGDQTGEARKVSLIVTNEDE